MMNCVASMELALTVSVKDSTIISLVKSSTKDTSSGAVTSGTYVSAIMAVTASMLSTMLLFISEMV